MHFFHYRRSVWPQLQIFNARTDPEIDAAFETVAQQRIRGLVAAADAFDLEPEIVASRDPHTATHTGLAVANGGGL